jgi:hypothetical protein
VEQVTRVIGGIARTYHAIVFGESRKSAQDSANERYGFHDNLGSDARVKLVVLKANQQAREKGGRATPSGWLYDSETV